MGIITAATAKCHQLKHRRENKWNIFRCWKSHCQFLSSVSVLIVTGNTVETKQTRCEYFYFSEQTATLESFPPPVVLILPGRYHGPEPALHRTGLHSLAPSAPWSTTHTGCPGRLGRKRHAINRPPCRGARSENENISRLSPRTCWIEMKRGELAFRTQTDSRRERRDPAEGSAVTEQPWLMWFPGCDSCE